ncbi:MAG: hypothetical protein JW388_0968 [Nitrospira sp.]|nr:hypothetical protein [Nitrospira sp.]
MEKTKHELDVELSEINSQLEATLKKNRALAESNARLINDIAAMEQAAQKGDEESADQKCLLVQVATTIFTALIVSKAPRSDSDIDTLALHCKGLAQRAIKVWIP